MKWRPFLSNLISSRDGKLWHANGDCQFPLNGWNFVSVRKAKFGWWVDTSVRFITTNREEFSIIKV